jgi:threonine dehydrogenase-like Zn-dependent dehydrogenase
VVYEITLIGSRYGLFALALGLLGTKQVDVESLIHGHYSLNEGLAAFEKAQTKGVLKVLLEMN